jgi:hypothetical protein
VSERRPLYPRLLRLRHLHPNAWQRAVLGEGALAVAALLVLADVASAWTLLVLPLGVAVVVKLHDVVAGVLAPHPLADADVPVGEPDSAAVVVVEREPHPAAVVEDEPVPVRPRRRRTTAASRGDSAG